jgi:hypothetical protein
MIYSRFGTKLTAVSKEQEAGGRLLIQMTIEGTAIVRNYVLADLTADDGMTEINATVEKLPWRVVEPPAARRARHFR